MPISHPFAKYEAGTLTCRACSVTVGEDARWSSHIATSGHAEAVAALKAKPRAVGASSVAASVPAKPAAIVQPEHATRARADTPVAVANDVAPVPVNPRLDDADAVAAALLTTSAAVLRASAGPASRRAPVAPSQAVPAPVSDSAIPARFFDDAVADMRARNINPAVAAKAAAETDWQEFQSFMGAVHQAAAVEEAEEETHYAEERSAAAAAENALYRGRLDVIRFTRQVLTSGRREGEDGDAAAPGVNEVAIAELVEEPVSFLTVSERSAVDADTIRTALAQKRQREQLAAEADDDDAELDWRRKGPRRA